MDNMTELNIIKRKRHNSNDRVLRKSVRVSLEEAELLTQAAQKVGERESEFIRRSIEYRRKHPELDDLINHYSNSLRTEARFHRSIHDASTPIFYIDPNSGLIKFANKSASGLLGLDSDRLVGMNHAAFFKRPDNCKDNPIQVTCSAGLKHTAHYHESSTVFDETETMLVLLKAVPDSELK